MSRNNWPPPIRGGACDFDITGDAYASRGIVLTLQTTTAFRNDTGIEREIPRIKGIVSEPKGTGAGAARTFIAGSD